MAGHDTVDRWRRHDHMALDHATYEEQVLRPLRGLWTLPDDLWVRYAVEGWMTRADLETHLTQVRALWSRKKGGRGHIADLCARLLQADEDLQRQPGDMTDPAWWRARAAGHQPGPVSGGPAQADTSGGVPPAPPAKLTASADRSVVNLTWSASPDPVSLYRVVRAEARDPRTESDGVAVAETADLSAQDAAAPAARNLRYAVFASADGRTWSRPAVAAVFMLPPVTRVELRAAAGNVVGTWQTPPGAADVRITRTAGRPPDGTDAGAGAELHGTGGSLTDLGLAPGVEYFYAFTAVYIDAAGRPVRAEPAVESVVVGSTASVPALAVQAMDAGPANRVRLTWPDAGEVRIRCADHGPPWQAGTTIPLRHLETYGHEVTGPRHSAAGVASLEAETPSGDHLFVPFAVAGAGAVVGAPVTLGSIEPVRSLRARRTDRVVTLSWEWPDQVVLAEVAWTTADGDTGRREISRVQFVEGNGFQLHTDVGCDIRVQAVATAPGGSARSAPVSISVPGPRARVSYRIDRPSGWWRRRSRRRIVSIRAERDCTGLSYVLVLAPRRPMPTSPAHGEHLKQDSELPLFAGADHTFEVEVPAGTSKPYWLRLFVTAPRDVAVTDPPISDMKVS